MFTEYMTFEEIRKEMEKERPALLKKTVAHAGKVRKVMRQTNMSSYHKHYDYVSPRKNRWVYMFDCEDKKLEQFYMSQYCISYTEQSYFVIVCSVATGRIFYYSSHFFTRYFQRENLEKENLHDIIRSYINANPDIGTQGIEQVGEFKWQAFSQLTEGVALGYLDQKLDIFEMRTFITNAMLKGSQVELSKQLQEKFKMHVMRDAPAKRE